MRLTPYLCLIGSLLCSHNIRTIEKFEPKQLKSLPDAVESGLVVSYHTLKIPGIKYCYNPAYIPDQAGTNGTLIVRVDDDELFLSEERKLRKSTLYAVRIDDSLNAISKPIPLQTFNDFTEDPRAVRLGENIAVICNEHPDIQKYNRCMVVHVYNKNLKHLRTYKPLYQNGKVEKNWTPLFGESLDFIYSFDPYTVISFDNHFARAPKVQLQQAFAPLIQWSKKWGTPRGGTPFVKIGDRILGFFHSSFATKPTKRRWFLFGAIELSANAPYSPRRISALPIYSKRFYQSHKSPTAPRKKFVVYPSGITTRDNQKIIRLFCGLNDSQILVIDIDYNKLESTMEAI